MAAPTWRSMADVSISFLVYFIIFPLASASINLDELNFVNYAVDILNKPVLIGQETSALMMHMRSKYGQHYQCILPEVVPSMKPLVSSSLATEPDFVGKTAQQEESTASSSPKNGIVDLLKPLETGPCLIKTKDWWTYEFCYGKYIKQFHLEDGKNSGPVMLLGLYESEFDWNNESQTENSDRNRLHRYHSQYYVNGTRCDLTGKPRRTEVQFLCEEGAGDYIAQVDEPESCRYLVRIHTMRVCHHPYLRPPPTNKPKSIVCSPVLTEDQYQGYLQQQEDERKIAEEEMQKWLKLQEAKLAQRKLSTEDQLQPGETSLEVQVDESRDNDNADVKDVDTSSSTTSNDDLYGEDVAQIMKVLPGPIQQLSRDLVSLYRESQEADAVQTDNKDEVVAESKVDEDEGLEKVMLGKIAGAINKLMEQLEKTEKEVGLANDGLEKLKTQWTKQLLSDVVNVRANDAEVEDAQDVDADNLGDFGKSDEIVMKKSDMEMESPVENIEAIDGNGDVYALKGDDVQSKISDKVRVKVGILDVNEARSAADKSKDNKEKQELEKALLKKLEQSGLDTLGRKVEVKIITSGYFDENGNEYTLLSDEDSKHFQAIVLKLLDGDQEVVENLAHQKKLEDGYKFNWSPQPKSAFNEEEEEEDT